MTDVVVFFVVSGVALTAGVSIILLRNAVHAALALVGVQLALAGLFLLQGAFFIAVLQIIVYAGAIMVLFVFVVMLLGVDRREALVEPLTWQRPLAFGLSALLVAEFAFLIAGRTVGPPAHDQVRGSVEVVATTLFTEWSLAFEATSVLLIVAVVGAVVLAKRRLG